MAPIKVRVRTPARQLILDADDALTVAQLKQVAAQQLGCNVAKLQLSLQPSYASPLQDGAKLTALGFKNGQMVFTKDDATGAAAVAAAVASAPAAAQPAAAGAANGSGSAAAAAPAPAPLRKLTSKCVHGPRGACQHCDPVTQKDMDVVKSGPLNKAGGRHVEKSSAPDSLTGDLEWLCRHRPDQMCVNCAPLKKGEKVDLEMLCQHGPEGRCVNCLAPDSTVDDRKFVTYDEWIEKRKAKCEHAFNATCVNCVSPSQVSHKMKSNCAKHRPWPAGLCSDCAPTPVECKLQEYRHVDFVSINNRDEMGGLIQLWDANAAAGAQRAAWLYGTVVPDPNYRHGQRVVVEALYEPPQRFDTASGGLVILPDKRERDVEAVAAACGLRRVGWLFTKRPKAKEGEPEVSPRELMGMATLQNAFPRGGGKPGSQFVSIVVRKTAAGIEPRGFQAADFMCALVRDGVLADPVTGEQNVKIRQPRPGSDDPPAPEAVVTSKDWGRRRQDNFDPDVGVVTMEVAAASGGAGSSAPKFKHAAFPVENREAYGITQSPNEVKKMFMRFKGEPLASRMSDFHLLCYLTIMFDAETAVMTAKAVTEGRPVPEGVQLMLQEITGVA